MVSLGKTVIRFCQYCILLATMAVFGSSDFPTFFLKLAAHEVRIVYPLFY